MGEEIPISNLKIRTLDTFLITDTFAESLFEPIFPSFLHMAHISKLTLLFQISFKTSHIFVSKDIIHTLFFLSTAAYHTVIATSLPVESDVGVIANNKDRDRTALTYPEARYNFVKTIIFDILMLLLCLL